MTANAMNAHAFDDMEDFPRQVMEVVGWLDRTLPEEHPYSTVQAMPSGLSSPEVWLLGSSDYSGALAAYLGLRFAFAHFINAHGGDAVARAYRNDFRPSLRESVPVFDGLRIRSLRADPSRCATTCTQYRPSPPADVGRARSANCQCGRSAGLSVHGSRSRHHRARARTRDHRHAGQGEIAFAGNRRKLRCR
jgi:hypothetical protein